MANNLIISYDLIKHRNYKPVHDAIKSLGSWAKIHESVWYVDSPKTASEARNIVAAACDNDDKVFVVDATNNDSAGKNLSDEVGKHIQDHW